MVSFEYVWLQYCFMPITLQDISTDWEKGHWLICLRLTATQILFYFGMVLFYSVTFLFCFLFTWVFSEHFSVIGKYV